MFLLWFALVVSFVLFFVLLLFLKWKLWEILGWEAFQQLIILWDFVVMGINNFMLHKKVYIVLMIGHTQLAIGFFRLKKPNKLFRSPCLLYDFHTNLQWRCSKKYFVVFVPHCMNIFHISCPHFFLTMAWGSVRRITLLWKTCDYKSNNGHEWVIH
jgi:hypothetical protein